MNANRIRILLEVYMDGDPVIPKGFSQAELTSEVNMLVVDGYLNPLLPSTNFALTKKGKVFVGALLEVPAPVQAWVMP